MDSIVIPFLLANATVAEDPPIEVEAFWTKCKDKKGKSTDD